MYLALIADLVSSKAISNRLFFQKELLDLLTQQSEQSRENLIAPFTITLGDEFQALYNRPDSLFRDFWAIREIIYPEHCRFACAFGGLSTAINTTQTIGMDGPCFHRARALIIELKKEKHSLLRFFSNSDRDLSFINSGLDLVFSFTRNWKENSIRILNFLMAEHKIESIARNLDMTIRGVYRNIKANHIQEILNYQLSAIAEIKSLWKSL